MNSSRLPSSYKDPSGFMFYYNNSLYRQINFCYKDNYDQLMNSGLYESLVKDNLLISHDEVEIPIEEDTYKIIKPLDIPFISYPYEWCFSQLKEAALLTLKIQKKAIEFGMTLKDASAYNVQFFNGKTIFIDTLSFEKYIEGKPWVAYRQFCQHFFAPLVLMSKKDIRFNQLFRIYIDGIPLDLANKLLGIKSYLGFSIFTHIKLHSRSQNYFSDKKVNTSYSNFNKNSFLGLIDNLYTAVKNLEWKPKETVWGYYYGNTNYSDEAFVLKKKIVKNFIKEVNAGYIWDLGANTGVFSRIAVELNAFTISIDSDPAAVELNFRECLKNNENLILPLLADLTNPSAGFGWINMERLSLIERGKADTVLALALIHHLAISNNLPFQNIAYFFSKICSNLIIEYVSKEDSQVKKLLQNREDIFTSYTQINFENDFSVYFNIVNFNIIKDSGRIIYLMKKKYEER